MPIRALTYQASPLALFDRFIDWSWPVLLDSQDAGRWDIPGSRMKMAPFFLACQKGAYRGTGGKIVQNTAA